MTIYNDGFYWCDSEQEEDEEETFDDDMVAYPPMDDDELDRMMDALRRQLR